MHYIRDDTFNFYFNYYISRLNVLVARLTINKVKKH